MTWIKSNENRSFNFVAPAGVADKTKYASFIYDGTQFVPTGTPVQVD